MAIRVNSRTAFLAVALGLAACGNEQSAALDAVEDAQGPDGTREPAGSEAAEDCLLVIWEQRAGAEDFGGEDERAYDRAHDKADGGAISCATATSASQFATCARTRRSMVARPFSMIQLWNGLIAPPVCFR